MYSTTTLAKSSKFSGRIVGTHQQLDLAARKILGRQLPRGRYFPSGREIIHFEGTRGPDGLKRKSPGIDEPSHMLVLEDGDAVDNEARPADSSGHENLDDRSVLTMILDHRWNLVKALKDKNHVRAAFEAAWMAHMITDGLTPAHHFPLSSVKNELMTDKEMMRVFGQPIKGMMHGRNMLETMRNNWLYWGARGHMSQHIAYEYGVAMIVATLPQRAMMPKMDTEAFCQMDTEKMFYDSLRQVQERKIYDRFREDGWTTELALETKNFLLPEIIKAIALGWFSAAMEAYKLKPRAKK